VGEVEVILDALLKNYGPTFAPVAVALLVLWKVYADAAKDRLSSKDVLASYQNLVAAYHTAVVENAKVTERLALLIEERTRVRP
jgi:hypothetical protein